jgi:hypothetical protein
MEHAAEREDIYEDGDEDSSEEARHAECCGDGWCCRAVPSAM